MYKIILQNIIILWNYIKNAKIIMKSNKVERKSLRNIIKSALAPIGKHINMHETYVFGSFLAGNGNAYASDKVFNYRIA